MKVEQLFVLPFFEQMVPQFVEPLKVAIAGMMTDNEEEAAGYLATTNEANDRVFDGMMDLVKNFYEEVLTDEEVDVMIEIYQNPAFMKLMDLMPTLMPRMVDWFEKNEKMLVDTVASTMAEKD